MNNHYNKIFELVSPCGSDEDFIDNIISKASMSKTKATMQSSSAERLTAKEFTAMKPERTRFSINPMYAMSAGLVAIVTVSALVINLWGNSGDFVPSQAGETPELTEQIVPRIAGGEVTAVEAKPIDENPGEPLDPDIIAAMPEIPEAAFRTESPYNLTFTERYCDESDLEIITLLGDDRNFFIQFRVRTPSDFERYFRGDSLVSPSLVPRLPLDELEYDHNNDSFSGYDGFSGYGYGTSVKHNGEQVYFLTFDFSFSPRDTITLSGIECDFDFPSIGKGTFVLNYTPSKTVVKKLDEGANFRGNVIESVAISQYAVSLFLDGSIRNVHLSDVESTDVKIKYSDGSQIDFDSEWHSPCFFVGSVTPADRWFMTVATVASRYRDEIDITSLEAVIIDGVEYTFIID